MKIKNVLDLLKQEIETCKSILNGFVNKLFLLTELGLPTSWALIPIIDYKR